MGMGEPLDNPVSLFEALSILTNDQFFNISQRKINISTIGVLPVLKHVVDSFPSINIALSLNSPFPKERQRLMPIEKKFPINKILPILDHQARKYRRKIFLSYVLLDGINNTFAHAKALAQLVHDRGDTAYLYHVNLIGYHPIDGASFKAPDHNKIVLFKNQLEKQRVKTTIRRSLGLSLRGACGQLKT